MKVLVVNVGSSSVKLRLLDAGNVLLYSETLDVGRSGVSREILAPAISGIADNVDAVGHRIVHGGTRFTGPALIDRQVEEDLRALADLAPLHQQRSLAGLDAVSSILPGVPSVACFDTAFHASMPEESTTYALPAEWREVFGIRRYGFHGLSHAYASKRAAAMLGEPSIPRRIVTCHLGAGASVAAVSDGCSVDTTMGFTPLEGLVMATRSGSVDPGIVTWLILSKGIAPEFVADALESSSGLLAIAGTPDMAEVEAGAASGNTDCELAISIFCHRLRAAIASMAASMSGIDALVFTGGIGEHSSTVRARTADGLGFLGAFIDDRANESARPDAEITADGATVHTLVIEAREDLQIANEVRTLLEEG